MNNWAIITPVEEKQVESQGFSLLRDDTIKCGNCGKPLISVLKVKEDANINTAIKAICPYCNDTSFWYKISGKIYIQATEGLSIDEAPVDKRNGIFFTNIKVIKND